MLSIYRNESFNTLFLRIIIASVYGPKTRSTFLNLPSHASASPIALSILRVNSVWDIIRWSGSVIGFVTFVA